MGVAVPRKRTFLHVGAGLLAGAVLLSAPFASASAAGFFENLFGGLGHVFSHRVEPPARTYTSLQKD
jgi:hypothetical protein